MIDAGGLSSSPCSYSSWQKEVTATFDMNSSEAKNLCLKIAGLASDRNISFSDSWTLLINSPYSSSSIAFCGL